MAIIVDSDTKLVVQGATGREGSFHTLRNRDYGTNVVAGVTPGKGGQDLDGIPIFDTVAEAVEEAGASRSSPGSTASRFRRMIGPESWSCSGMPPTARPSACRSSSSRAGSLSPDGDRRVP